MTDKRTRTETKEIKFGATAGPYSDMVTKAIKPGLEEKGYTVKLVNSVIIFNQITH